MIEFISSKENEKLFLDIQRMRMVVKERLSSDYKFEYKHEMGVMMYKRNNSDNEYCAIHEGSIEFVKYEDYTYKLYKPFNDLYEFIWETYYETIEDGMLKRYDVDVNKLPIGMYKDNIVKI